MSTNTSLANRSVLDMRSTADLRSNMRKDPQSALKQAAQQFEGLVLQMMLKSMREATPQDGPMDSDQTRFFTSILDQQLAQNLSGQGQGKLGFARLIEQQLGRNLAGGKDAGNGTTAPLDAMQRALVERQAASSAAWAAGGAERKRGTTAVDPTAAGAEAPANAGEFVNRIWPHAVEAANAIGVPARFLVAHSALESAWGKSEIRTASGAQSYNLFGVKAGRGWTGATAEVQTTEYENGVAQTVREKFRVYGSYAEAFRDYASMLRSNSRFAGVLGQQEGNQFARSLQQSGYATDPLYADKLSRIINGSALRQALAG